MRSHDRRGASMSAIGERTTVTRPVHSCSARETPYVVAVVVAYDRRPLLRECLEALRRQSTPPDAVLVVDNASTDGTPDMVRADFPEVSLLVLQRNTGGAGGFATGIAAAVDRLGADAVWVMDDDTVPTEDALTELLSARASAPAGTEVIASRVLWHDGRDHPMNTPRVRPFSRRAALRAAAEHECYPIRSASFVSVLIDAPAVRWAGLPIADYFLWNDDFEYTSRILRFSRGYVARRSVVVHKTARFGDVRVDPGARFRLEVRNKVWMLTRSRALSPAERVLYAGSTVRRWATTFVHSGDRSTLSRGLATGLREGLLRAPRSNAHVLAGAVAVAPFPSGDTERTVTDAI